MNDLPITARLRLVAPALGAMRAIPAAPAATIPVTQEQWEESLRDAGLVRAPERFEEIVLTTAHAVSDAALAHDAHGLRRAASALAERVAAIAFDLWCLSALGPGSVAVPLRDAVVDMGISVLEGVADPPAARTLSWDRPLRTALEAVCAHNPP